MGELEVELTYHPGHVYRVPQLTCVSDRDGALDVDVADQHGTPITNMMIDMGKLRQYTFVYTCHDKAGYSAKPLTKHITVHPVTAPPTPFPCQPVSACCSNATAVCGACKSCMSVEDFCNKKRAMALGVNNDFEPIVYAGCTASPTPSPTPHPTANPTVTPTAYPTAYPTAAPTKAPTKWGGRITEPTAYPTSSPITLEAHWDLLSNGTFPHSVPDSGGKLNGASTKARTPAPTSFPTGPPVPANPGASCANGPNTENDGWSGPGWGWNYCNKCYCNHGILTCTTLTCYKPVEMGQECEKTTCSYETVPNHGLTHLKVNLTVMKVHHSSTENSGDHHHCYFHQLDQRCKCVCYGSPNTLWHSYKDWHTNTNNGKTEMPYRITYKITHLTDRLFAVTHTSGTSWSIGDNWSDGNVPLDCASITVDAPVFVYQPRNAQKMVIKASKLTIVGDGTLDLTEQDRRRCCKRLGPQYIIKPDKCEALLGAPVRGPYAN